jgi:hypothetical protein
MQWLWQTTINKLILNSKHKQKVLHEHEHKVHK